MESNNIGTVIMAPVQIGQTVYVVNATTERIFENVVVCIKIISHSANKNTVTLEYRNKNGETSRRKYTWSQVEKKIFFTPKAASDALAATVISRSLA